MPERDRADRADQPSPDLSAWERHLCAPLTGRKVIAAFEVLGAMTRLVTQLRRWGAQRPLFVADGVGTGPLPVGADAEIVLLDTSDHTSLTDQVRARLHPEARLTASVTEAVERYDPQGQAIWWLSPVPPNSPLLGRPVLGGRPPHQVALEDKLAVDGLLDAIDEPRPPSVVASASYESLMVATDLIRRRSGADDVVWAGDSRDGLNGGSDYVRWIRSGEQARAGAVFFATRCDRVRVTPFLDGVPCSIHGIVLGDGVVVLRPVELAILRDLEEGRFLYSGMGTTWDPPGADRVAMRDLARRMGDLLRERYGYRGGFGLDGVLTMDGFRVTEINPRFSGGLTRLARAAPDVQLELVQVNALIDRDVQCTAGDLEARALELLDAAPFMEAMGVSTHATARETAELAVTVSGARVEPARTGQQSDGTVVHGPSSMGSFVRLTLDAGVARPGDRSTTLAVKLLAFSDRRWGTRFGDVSAPLDVRA
ncbi:MAG: hypothetical protein ACR2LE_01610 [Nocardioidaceae bacterium]